MRTRKKEIREGKNLKKEEQHDNKECLNGIKSTELFVI